MGRKRPEKRSLASAKEQKHFPSGSAVNNLPSMREMQVGSWVRKIPREGNGNSLQYSCLGNPTDRGAWWATVHGVAKSGTGLND